MTNSELRTIIGKEIVLAVSRGGGLAQREVADQVIPQLGVSEALFDEVFHEAVVEGRLTPTGSPYEERLYRKANAHEVFTLKERARKNPDWYRSI